MTDRAKSLFTRLQDAGSIRGLIGQSEDVHFDCKEWPTNEADAQKIFAKAACGLANAEGGVLVVGMRARAVSKDDPDIVDSAVPVVDTRAVKSRILDLTGQLVEPRIEGVQVVEVNEASNSTSGFVVVYVPACEGSPRRSRKDWKFYQRIGSGTFPMEYFQIEERFGKRPPPKLELYLEPGGVGVSYSVYVPSRWFEIGLTNSGRSIAKFPSIRYKRSSGLIASQHGIDGSGGFGLAPRASDNHWVAFRGGLDEVIYPGETRKICSLRQDAQRRNLAEGDSAWVFPASTFSCEISCEGTPTASVEKTIAEASPGM
jgi:hypothetical protein